MDMNTLGFGLLEITLIVGFVALILWVFRSAAVASESGERAKFVEAAPTLMTSLGILGTFVGIVIGLYSFDPNHIDESIRELLGGLRTAFVTSVFGMGATIVFKWRTSSRAQIDDGSQVIHEVGPKEIYGQLEKQTAAMDLLLRAVGGSEENSMVGQLKLLRTDVNDLRSSQQRHQAAFEEQLWQQLREFADMLSKSATEQVIEALRQVIVEFNEKLTEQFGDNFKRLDESVKKLVDWQVNYMTQLEQMIQLFDQGVQSIDATRGAVIEIKEQTGRIPDDMKALATVITVNQNQIEELTRHLEAFMALRQQAIVAVPEIQQKLEEIGNQLRDGAEKMHSVMLKGAVEFGDQVTRTNSNIENMAKEVALKTETISTELTDAMIKVEQNTDRIKNGVSEAVATAMDAVQTNIIKSSEATLKVVAETSENLRSETERIHQQSGDTFKQLADSVNRELEAILSAVRNDVERSLGGVEKQIQEAVSQTGEAVNTQLRAVDSALEQQLNKALSDLGTALASIARRLVDIYDTQASDSQSQTRRP